MGLTIHYSISVRKSWLPETIRAKLEALRQFCMDLPVESVSEINEFTGKDCEPTDNDNDEFRWAKIQSSRHLESPWQPGTSYRQYPSHTLVFEVWPAPGCEVMNLGVCTFPEFTVPKREENEGRTFADIQFNKPAWSLAVADARYYPASARVLKQFAKRWNLRHMPLSKDWIRSYDDIHREVSCRVVVCHGRYQSHRRGYAPSWVMVEIDDRMQEFVRWRFKGTVDEAKELLSSPEFKADLNRLVWGGGHTISGQTGTWGSFCKTQYANSPSEGGIANFIRAHVAVCAILEKAGQLGFRVQVSDEGDFWTKRDIKALAETVGEWDVMIAGFFGAMKDATPEGTAIESAIAGRPDFELLEMKAQSGKIGELLAKIRDALPKKKIELAAG